MLNPTNGDPSHVVANYVEEYLDLVESLPFDLQRSVSLMKEIDAKYQGKLSQCGHRCARHKCLFNTSVLIKTNAKRGYAVI